ncbi:hypothetical protein KY328_00915 [Candidatus Woesearchaeota archaeon]|nr:hypothetical protein [Candidatus Woesearchaeota archaeon]
MNKRGQITLFIIIGIVLIITVGTVIYFRQQAVEPVVVEEVVPEEVAPLKLFVEECMQQLGTRALELAGEQGGYVNPSSHGITYNAEDSTEGNGIEFTSSLVPYWYYLTSSNTCRGTCAFTTARPSLRKGQGEPSIQNMVEQYVVDNMADCLNNFLTFEQYQVTPTGGMQLSSVISPIDVRFNLQYPIEIKIGDTTTDISSFTTSVDIALPEMYEVANELANSQGLYCFLEHDVLELLTAFGRADENSLPPMSDMKFDDKGVIWFEDDVRYRVEDLLMSYMQMLQVQGSRNFHQIMVSEDTKNSDIINRVYSNMIIPISAPKYNVYFTYINDWPIYLSLGKGPVVRPSSYTIPFLGFGMQKYNIGYDVSWPVVVEVNDPEALGGRGYSFKFALEGNIRNNVCLYSDFDPVEFSSISGASMLCDENKRNSGVVNLTVKDERGVPVVGAFVTFMSDDQCPIGITSEAGELAEKFPVAIGSLSVEHPDYLETNIPFTTDLDKDGEIEIVLQKSREVKFIILKKNYRKQPNWAFNNWQIPLEYNEQALITFTRIGGTGDNEYITSASYSGNQSGWGEDYPDEYFSTVELYPGEYDVEIALIDYTPLNIPASSRSVKSGLFKKSTINIPEINMDNWQSGGLELNSMSRRWRLEASTLDRTGYLIFNAIGVNKDDIKMYEDLDFIADFEQLSVINRNYLEPEVNVK